nr:MAG TPA: hypothetical protein [Caudoviricetes sp.]
MVVERKRAHACSLASFLAFAATSVSFRFRLFRLSGSANSLNGF